MRLSEYLGWAMRQPWGWGVMPGLDCCKFVSRWVIACGYVDPMVLVWRTPYDSEISAFRRIQSGGGLVALWADGMAHIGISAADDLPSLAPGDVGIINRPTVCGGNQAAGIWTGDRWVTLGIRGLDFGPAVPMATWRV